MLSEISNYKDHIPNDPGDNDVDDYNNNVENNEKRVRDTTDKEPQDTPPTRQKTMKKI